MKYREPKLVYLKDIYPIFRQLDWSDPLDTKFSFRKAYVCSAFSQWAYAAIPAWEANRFALDNVHLFNASLVYNQLASQPNRFDFQSFIREQRGPDGESIEVIADVPLDVNDGRLMIVFAFLLNRILFITIRGTANLADLIIDAKKIIPGLSYQNGPFRQCGFHHGFNQALDKSFKEIEDIILRFGGPVYVMGHSLGGALSAMIFARWNMPGSPYKNKIHSAYTFGMPRYGTIDTMKLLPNPHLTMNPSDVIPELPSRLDFADGDSEYSSIDAHQLSAKDRSDLGLFGGIREVIRKFPHHSIENYMDDILNLVHQGHL